MKEHRLKEPDKTQYEIYNSLKTWVAECRNWEQLTTKLKEVGIEIEFKIKGNSDEVQGIRFKKNNYYFNGSKVDRMFSYSKINYQLSQNAKTNSVIQSHSMKNSTLSVGEHVRNSFGGLFNISSGSGTDKNETDFQHLMRKKKKKRKFGRQI